MTKLSLQLRWQLEEADNARVVPPELFLLLTEIKSNGSLQAACLLAGLAYRHAWGMIQRWSQHLGTPLVLMQRGRGARLTGFGQTLLAEHARAQAAFIPQFASVAQQTSQQLQSARNVSLPLGLSISASHSFALLALRDLLVGENINLALQTRGSLEALQQYRHGKCDLAGFHVPAEPLAGDLLPRYVRYLNPEQDVLLILAERDQGLMVAKGNPLKIHDLQALTKRSVRFINRQPNSGTRLLFDLLLKHAGIKDSRINGYHDEEFTHSAVAAFIASGSADAALGEAAASRVHGLDFVPLIRETYYLVMQRDMSNEPALDVLKAMLSGDAYAKRLHALTGYHTERAGRLLAVKDLLTR